ncbi:hypothetical protein Q1695_002320 [Nippostrongylus brasiliensis]|nr:hypothetical protein Q1695_002320 [Nippostrongylus brasiliensis]
MMSYNGQDRHLKFGTTPRLPEAIVDCEFVRMDCIEKDIEGVVSSLTVRHLFFSLVSLFGSAKREILLRQMVRPTGAPENS